MIPIEVKNPFIRTTNVRNLDVMMRGLALAAGEGRFGLVYSESGRGKSRAVVNWHGTHDSIYVRTKNVWKTNPTEFLGELCFELGIRPKPKGKVKCFNLAVDALLQQPRTVLIDEIERLPMDFLEIMRDLTEFTGSAVVLIGEEELVEHMRQNRRVWRRTFQRLEFKVVGPAEIKFYIQEATKDKNDIGLNISNEIASVIDELSGGNFGDIRVITIYLADICNAKKAVHITRDMVMAANRTRLSEKEI